MQAVYSTCIQQALVGGVSCTCIQNASHGLIYICLSPVYAAASICPSHIERDVRPCLSLYLALK